MIYLGLQSWSGPVHQN